MSTNPPIARPTTQGERHLILDVFRGFALLGVLIANLVELGGEDVLATGDQLAALPSAAIDAQTSWVLDLLVFDKANTLFAVLFGIGFWIMLERLSARGAAFEHIYLRRITLLTVIGFIHLFGWFAWDILHIYGLMAFALFFSRHLSDRALLWIGLVLMVMSRPVIEWMINQSGVLSGLMDLAYTEQAILERQTAAVTGDFLGFVGAMNVMTWYDWFISGIFIAWLTYALGRFYIGAWIARQGWIQTADQRIEMVRALVIPLFIIGLGLQIGALVLQESPGASWAERAPFFVELLHSLATPFLAAGYVCGLTLLFFTPMTRWLVWPFAPVGQMALTNYLLQSPFILFILTGIGPGLGLAGRAGSTDYTLYAIGFFVVQIVFSFVWMRAFQYGPAEWLWRAATYQTLPKLRRTP